VISEAVFFAIVFQGNSRLRISDQKRRAMPSTGRSQRIFAREYARTVSGEAKLHRVEIREAA
jgi:hypothetical protein